MLQEIKKRRNPAGYLSFADQTEIDLMFTFASQSKNPNITKMRDQERSLATNVMEREAANKENKDKEERAQTAATAKRARLQGIAKDLPVSQVDIDGVIYKKPDLPKPAPTGTRRVTTDPVGRETVSETTPMPPAGTPAPAVPAAPAAPAVAPAAPAANPLASIVSSGGKIKKVGDTYNAFDKDGKFIGSYSVGK